MTTTTVDTGRLQADGVQHDAGAANYRLVHDFAAHTSAEAGGSAPVGGLTATSAGPVGLTGSLAGHHHGAVYRINDGGKFKWLHRFKKPADGAAPQDELLTGPDGRLYGVTAAGGLHGAGTVFCIEDGRHSVLHHMKGGAGGTAPSNGLCLGRDGLFYGLTREGGDEKKGRGLAFSISANGDYRVLHAFAGGPDPWQPDETLVVGADGALYGTGRSGRKGYMVYRLTPDGEVSMFHQFPEQSATAARQPSGGLVADAAGQLYGVTSYDGAHGSGTVFRLMPDGQIWVLHAFGPADGKEPQTLTLARDGWLYGTTVWGGPKNGGTVFALRPDGTGFRVLHAFDAAQGDGTDANGRLLDAGDGWLYGTSRRGGRGLGTVYAVRGAA